jgi:23S rRNA (cytosine1962-C5)-methyltransferase
VTPTLTLPENLKRPLSAGHPWVYRDHVPRGFQAKSGTWVRISAGGFTAYALWDDSSPIALRVFSERQLPDAAWVAERVQTAFRGRQALRDEQTSTYRWLFGEGDGLPGITVDLYGQYAVLVTYSAALDGLVPWVVSALSATTRLAGIVRRRDGELELLSGRKPPAELIVEERGMRLAVDLAQSQKTGLFLDHRENRRFVRELGVTGAVLNLFSYTGAFSVSAALGGATEVVSVDAAPVAEAARSNFRLNALATDGHEFVEADVFEYLEAAGDRRFDLVISDPPSFAKSKERLERATKAYLRLTTLGLRATEPGGLYAAASCTSQVSPEAFKEVLAEAARRARRRFQIIHEAGQPLDHPVMAQHREGRYLKFVVGRVLGVV